MRHFSSVLALISLSASVAGAQITKPTALGIAAGFSAPTGQFDNSFDIGYNILGTVAFQPRASSLGLRIDGMLNEFKLSSGSANTRVWSATGNLVISPATYMGPYLIGGLGVYATTTPSITGSRSDSDLGLNIGAGFRFPLSGFDSFFEARWHRVSDTNIRFVPVSFGVLF
jgi:hypothetical protein